uniref:Uncharacterized protein n=1 Tax=viral metagenome TaxID=1070528 RepID=A0A6C0EVI3_9ZZZZ
MYIIVSTSNNYKGEIIGVDCIIRANTIGHEIHLTRPILIFLLCNNLISLDDTIVTKNNERFFLYSDIFKNIIEYDNLPINSEVIDITHINTLIENRLNFDIKIDIEEKFPILKKMRTNDVIIRTDEFNNLINKINYIPLIIDNDFVVIHDRNTTYNYSNVNDSIYLINNILHYFPNLNIVLFTINKTNINLNQIKVVNRIDEYASYMNHSRCRAVFSPFSGAGQLAQFCHNMNIYYYIGAYSFYKGNVEELFIQSNEKSNIYSSFDLKKTTETTVKVFNTTQEIIQHIAIISI